MWDWKWTCCLSVFSCWSLFLFDLGLSSFPAVSPFIYSNVQNPTVFGTFFGGLLPPNAACDRGCLRAVAVGVCSGKMSRAFGLNPCWTCEEELSGFADKGLVVGCWCSSWGPSSKQSLNSRLWVVNIASSSKGSWQLLLVSISFRRGIPGAAVERIPWAETQQSFYKGVQTHTEMKLLLWKYMTNGTKVIKVFVYLLNSPTVFPLKASQGCIVGTQIRTTTCCLSKETQRSLSTQGKLFINLSKDRCVL